MTSAFVSEIYASVQGEGPYAGERQIFVRLAGCPLRCRYCDTPASLVVTGHRRWTVEEVLSEVEKLRRRSKAKTVSVTGGEPLVQPLFLVDFFSRLKKKHFRTYLETAGIHAPALSKMIRWIDVVSMDIKLPSSTGRVYWKEHRAFLAAGGKKIFTKVVIERQTRMNDVKKAVALVQSIKTPPLLVLQPATAIEGQSKGPTGDQVAEAYAIAAAKLPRVLVIPQQHKLWGVP